MALGYHSVKECQANLSSSEFAEWLAYDRLEPFGNHDQVYFGTIAATVANTTRQKKSDKIYQWSDFFTPYEDQKEPQSWEDQLSIAEMLNEAFGGLDLRANKKPQTA